MALVLSPEVGLPSLDDARQAAEALAQMGAGQVLVFGSVARGEAAESSDIDLVAIFDDLDYTCRRYLKRDLEKQASATAGRTVDVLVTDRPEWKQRTQRVSSSVEAAIAADAVILVDRPAADGAVDWDKEIGMPADNRAEALERLHNASDALRTIRDRIAPGHGEQAATEQGDWGELRDSQHRRMVDICSAAGMAIENSLKSAVCLSGSPARRTHDIAELAGAVPVEYRAVVEAIDKIDPKDITVWRQGGDYLDSEPQYALEDLAAHSWLLAEIASDAVDAAAGCFSPNGDPPEEAARARNLADAIREDLAANDPLAGQRLR